LATRFGFVLRRHSGDKASFAHNMVLLFNHFVSLDATQNQTPVVEM
jgi:hypothetical protein